nr:zinc finger, CCHC-type, Gag-polypeptide of LTR copia-type [Tanacetum cinerariifolium]
MVLYRHRLAQLLLTDPNPAYSSWVAADQRALVIILSLLSEEVMAETLGHTSARGIWCALEAAYSHDSVKRMHTLQDYLCHLKKGSSTVAEFARKFKGAESHELFLQSINGSTVATCNVSDQSLDWVVDSGSSIHMTSSSFNLDSASAYSGNEIVFFANGHTAPISHIGKTSITPYISLQDVIVNRLTKEPLARGRRKHGLYVLEQGQQAFLANISSRRSSASFEL